eukprot:SAG31_NODE_41873_length_274_cov_0.588571_1_plen_53_part_01
MQQCCVSRREQDPFFPTLSKKCHPKVCVVRVNVQGARATRGGTVLIRLDLNKT